MTWLRVFLATVETKVKAAALGTLAASLAAAFITALMSAGHLPHTSGQWWQFVLISLGPPIVAALSGYAAPHTPRPARSHPANRGRS
jgi:hypothetical protein